MAKTELAKAYVQIIPSADGIKGKLTEVLGGEADSAGSKAGLGFAGKLKGIIAAAGIGTLVKESLSAGGDLQQSLGGIDTIYGEATDAAKKYAAEAATAGISMNDYAEQAVSFGASLRQAFGGDMTRAAEAANTAILDMADNSAKMGTDIESVQNAYQGFAKQNYTMLDNLKLGYGGTKTEMQRLLSDAEKLSGVTYNIDNLGDVYEAIHVIQEDLGLTGVAAAEAKETFSGSMNAMKAAATNVMANLTLGEDIGPSLNVLRETVFTFLTDNLFPMVGNILMGLPDILNEALGMAIRGINILSDNADEILNMGLELVSQLAVGIVTAVPYIVEAAWNLCVSLGNALLTADWIGITTNMIEEFRGNMQLAAGEILGVDSNIIDSVVKSISDNLPKVAEAALNMVLNFLDTITLSLPDIVREGSVMLKELVVGILQSLPALIDSSIQVCANFLSTISERLPDILRQGGIVIAELVKGIAGAIPEVVSVAWDVITHAKDTFLEYDWIQLGKDLIAGIAQGISNAAGTIWEAIGGALDGAVNWAREKMKISSPSKVMSNEIGQWIPKGIASGISKNLHVVEYAMNELTEKSTGKIRAEVLTEVSARNFGAIRRNDSGLGYTQHVYVTSPKELSPSEVARHTRNANRQMILAMKGIG